MVTGSGLIVYVIGVAVALVYAVPRGRTGLMKAYVASIPWFGLQSGALLTVSLDRFIGVILCFASIVPVLRRRSPKPFLGFAIWATLVTVVSAPLLPDTARLYPTLRGELRWLPQLVMWAIVIGTSWAYAAERSWTFVRDVLRVLVVSILLLAALGFLQTAVYYASGVDLFPIGILEAEGAQRIGMMNPETPLFGLTEVFRASSLGGEPKHLAYGVVIGITIIFAELTLGSLLEWDRTTCLLALVYLSISLISTFSTQGIILAIANISLITFGRALLVKGRSLFAGVLVVAAVVVSVTLIGDLASVIVERTIARAQESGFVEDWNEVILRWLQDAPVDAVFGVGLGNVHLHAVRYVTQSSFDYMDGVVFVAKSGFLRLVSETGAVGLVLFMGAVLRPLLVLYRRARRDATAWNGFMPLALVGACTALDFAFSADGPWFLPMVTGLMWAAACAGTAEELT